MSRYIDADALLETIRHFVDTMSVCTSTEYCTGLRFMKKQAIKAVENAPTVDAVPVVRCKECRWRHDDSSTMWLPCMEIKTSDDWFCADGERRSNETDR